MTDADSDFSPTDAAGLAAWFAHAEANAAGLRRRLDALGSNWQEPRPDPVPQKPKSGPVVRGTGRTSSTPAPEDTDRSSTWKTPPRGQGLGA